MQASKRIEPEPTKYVPSGVAKLYRPECGLSSGPALCAFRSCGLGVSTFPWGRMTDTRERRSRHLSFYDPKSRGSVRESGDSVECLEECSGARQCTFGELGARTCGWSAQETRGARGACASARAGARLAHGWHYSPESDDSSPETH
ncbi:hypothetical protein CRG98_015699 [Punica granatum]|uniref:Uncharacterized protein n=1 Tax=Punica granatum TaxID=22663 RepID=A0A2I0K5U5_PUNGR|nr:hypothetical protein CRG98_015699 [Punica granatum]